MVVYNYKMISYILKRIIQGIFVVFIVIFVVFVMIRVIPGDPARLIAAGGATPESVEKIRVELGIDKPILTQFKLYISKLVRGDLGNSIFRSKGGSAHHGIHHYVTADTRSGSLTYEKAKVSTLIFERLPLTLLLTAVAMVMALIISFYFGIMGAIRKGSIFDNFSNLLITSFQSLPNFWIGIILILVFSVNLKLIPSMGYKSFIYILLPALTLALSLIPKWLRTIKSSVEDIYKSPLVKGLRARGVRESTILFKHVIRSVLVCFTPVFSLDLGYLLGGSIIVEFVFDFPGLGLLTIVSVLQRDFTLVQGIVLFFACLFVLINILMDIAYVFIDPRTSLQ